MFGSFAGKALVSSLMLVVGPAATAGVYKCTVNGKTAYQDAPCVQEVPKAAAASTIEVGMTADHVTKNWGSPRRVNRSVSSGLVREQWIYPGRPYVYIENGRVAAVQP